MVKKIPRGSFLTYKEVAEKSGHPKACRAVGNILRHSAEQIRPELTVEGLSRSHKNRNLYPPKFLPAQISKKLGAGEKKTLAGKKVPCHRVIKSNGTIGGYRGGTKKKINLLRKEGIIVKRKIALPPHLIGTCKFAKRIYPHQIFMSLMEIPIRCGGLLKKENVLIKNGRMVRTLKTK